MRIIVTGYIIRRPVGGLAWHYLHYVLGLAQMGHEVYYLEDSEDYPSCFDPDKKRATTERKQDDVRQPFEQLGYDPIYGLRFISSIYKHLGLAEQWIYYDAHTQEWLGPVASRIMDVLSTADILLNISHSVPVRPWLKQIPSRVLVDTDPVFGQIRHMHVPGWLDRAVQHNVFTTFGENYGTSTCTTPIDGLPWKSTRQPIVLDSWPVQDPPREMKFTTVMSWKSYDTAKSKGTEYGLKEDSFSPYVDLPRNNDKSLELALDSSPELRQLLATKGWSLLDALEVTRDPWSYQRYVQQSAAEFSIAKQAYVMTRSGWFSERSAAYLASGRPVLTQDTGFSDWLEADAGIIPFDSPEEALLGIERIEKDYKRQSDAARQCAEIYFSHENVLTGLLEHARSPVDQDKLASEATGSVMLREFKEALNIIDQVIRPESSFVLIDDNQWGVSGKVAGRKCLPFLERNGLYWGNPADDETAIRELERLRLEGVESVVFAKSALWWMEHYPKFHKHIESRYENLARNDIVIVYDLRTISTPAF